MARSHLWKLNISLKMRCTYLDSGKGPFVRDSMLLTASRHLSKSFLTHEEATTQAKAFVLYLSVMCLCYM